MFGFHSLPSDDRQKEWVDAISPYADAPYIGRICSEHFYDVDFYKNVRTNRLKKHSVPRIFDEIHETDETDETNYINVVEENGENEFEETIPRKRFRGLLETNEAVEAVEVEELEELDKVANIGDYQDKEKNEWYHHYLNEKAERNIEVQKLLQRIKTLEHTLEVNKKHTKFLENKLRRENATKQSLQDVLAELNAEKLLNQGNLEALKASIFLILRKIAPRKAKNIYNIEFFKFF